MAQFDVYLNTNPETNRSILYLLDVQADLLSNLATRVVVPLISASSIGRGIKYLNPSFSVKRTRVVMSTAELAGVPVKSLGEKICSLKEHRSEIIGALDFLTTGF